MTAIISMENVFFIPHNLALITSDGSNGMFHALVMQIAIKTMKEQHIETARLIFRSSAIATQERGSLTITCTHTTVDTSEITRIREREKYLSDDCLALLERRELTFALKAQTLKQLIKRTVDQSLCLECGGKINGIGKKRIFHGMIFSLHKDCYKFYSPILAGISGDELKELEKKVETIKTAINAIMSCIYFYHYQTIKIT